MSLYSVVSFDVMGPAPWFLFGVSCRYKVRFSRKKCNFDGIGVGDKFHHNYDLPSQRALPRKLSEQTFVVENFLVLEGVLHYIKLVAGK